VSEISKILIGVLENKFVLLSITIFGTLSFPRPAGMCLASQVAIDKSANCAVIFILCHFSSAVGQRANASMALDSRLEADRRAIVFILRQNKTDNTCREKRHVVRTVCTYVRVDGVVCRQYTRKLLMQPSSCQSLSTNQVGLSR